MGAWHFSTFEALKKWVEENSDGIDEYPSAWCAVEMAFLDLFARERNCAVEKLFDLNLN